MSSHRHRLVPSPARRLLAETRATQRVGHRAGGLGSVAALLVSALPTLLITALTAALLIARLPPLLITALALTLLVGGAHVANILLGLAIGGVTGHWLVAFAIFVVATIVSFHGFLSGARLPSGVMVVVSLVALALCSGGGSAA